MLLFDEGGHTGFPEERKNMDGRMAMRPYKPSRKAERFGGRLDLLHNDFTPTPPSPIQGGGG